MDYREACFSLLHADPGWGRLQTKTNANTACFSFFISGNSTKQAWRIPEMKNAPSGALVLLGGEGGIRTRDRLLTYTHFPGVLLQPLGHLSGNNFTGLDWCSFNHP